MTSFKIKGFRIYTRYTGGSWQIELDRNNRYSLKTTDREQATGRAKAVIAKYLTGKIKSLENYKAIKLSEYLKRYLKDKDYDSIKTEKGYASAVRVFIAIKGDIPIRSINAQDIKDFKQGHRGRRLDTRQGKVSKVSINSYLRHLKAILRHAKDGGYIQSVPKIELYKIPKKQPVILLEDAKKRIFEKMKAEDTRMLNICKFALFTGCRRSEIVSARWENYRGFTLKVVGKGGHERTVPLVHQAKKYMGPPKKEGPIFWQAHPDTYTHYFKKHAVACGVFNVSFHKMRHTAATEMLESGVPLHVVQNILGHTDIATTEIYAQVMEKYMLEEMQKFGAYLGDG
jgi:integrase